MVLVPQSPCVFRGKIKGMRRVSGRTDRLPGVRKSNGCHIGYCETMFRDSSVPCTRPSSLQVNSMPYPFQASDLPPSSFAHKATKEETLWKTCSWIQRTTSPADDIPLAKRVILLRQRLKRIPYGSSL